MAKKKVNVKTNKKDDKILFAFLATFLSIIGFVIAIVAKRDDKYVMYYARQSLVIFIISVIISIVSAILMFIPVIGTIISVGAQLVLFILWIVSWIYALSGEEKEIEFISEWAEKIKI